MICFSILYCEGLKANLSKVTPILCAAGLLGLWDVLTVGTNLDPVLQIWLVAPSVVLTNFWIILIGWAFVVRWGITAIPYFVITVIYAICQPPAYLAAFVFASDMNVSDTVRQTFDGLKYVFLLLAIGKVSYALMFFVMFLCKDPSHSPDFTQPRYMPPAKGIPLHPKIKKIFVAAITTVFAAMVAAIAKMFLERA